jgi:hypothetical protein
MGFRDLEGTPSVAFHWAENARNATDAQTHGAGGDEGLA